MISRHAEHCLIAEKLIYIDMEVSSRRFNILQIDPAADRVTATFSGHTGAITSLKYLPAKEKDATGNLFSASLDGSVMRWDIVSTTSSIIMLIRSIIL